MTRACVTTFFMPRFKRAQAQKGGKGTINIPTAALRVLRKAKEKKKGEKKKRKKCERSVHANGK